MISSRLLEDGRRWLRRSFRDAHNIYGGGDDEYASSRQSSLKGTRNLGWETEKHKKEKRTPPRGHEENRGKSNTRNMLSYLLMHRQASKGADKTVTRASLKPESHQLTSFSHVYKANVKAKVKATPSTLPAAPPFDNLTCENGQ